MKRFNSQWIIISDLYQLLYGCMGCFKGVGELTSFLSNSIKEPSIEIYKKTNFI